MTTARDTAEALAERFHSTYERLAPSFGYQTRAESAVAWAEVPHKELMIATCAELLAGFVVVACPHGGRVVVSRESKPCEPCGGAGQWYHQDTYDAVSCESCGGSGVVEATTIHGLAEVRLGWIDEDGAERPLHLFAVERMLGDETLYRLEQVALPEETPQ